MLAAVTPYFKKYPVLGSRWNTKFIATETTKELTRSELGICLIITVCYSSEK
jgi:hypothetical protein